MMIDPVHWSGLIQGTISLHHPSPKVENHVPIDGKTLRGSKCSAKDVKAIHMVSAWSVENNILLGEVKTASKSGEVTAIPLLLELLDLEGATVSIDAIACNEKIIQAILAQKASYILALKNNQPTLYAAVTQYVQDMDRKQDYLIADYFDDEHSRAVRRRYFSFDAPHAIQNLGLSHINTVLAVETISSCKYDQKVTSQWRYYITNHQRTHTGLSDYIRGHWSIESIHWLLDVHLNDDKDKKYEKNAAENFAKTKRFLLNLVKSRPPQRKKRSVRANLKRVGWDMRYLDQLLCGLNQ